MNAAAAEAPTAGASPFGARTALGLVLFGALVFVALLWMIGNGLAQGRANDGGGHAEGQGLNGYAALADLLARSGHPVQRSRTRQAFAQEGLLVLTPTHDAAAKDVMQAIVRHRAHGPTLLVLPKWIAMPVPAQLAATMKAKPGWVMLIGRRSPGWVDEVATFGKLDARIDNPARGGRWFGLGHAGGLPSKAPVQTISSGQVVSIVRDGAGQTLAGYLDDGTANGALLAAAGYDEGGYGEEDEYENETDAGRFGVTVVAEPDLLDNYGMADRDRAALGVALVSATAGEAGMPVIFDMTLAGLERSDNLLTLAFAPPFLAATLCLLLAAAATGWRAFLRFGPPLAPGRAIAFGKRALVANAAGLIVRSGRLHLLGRPYADAARQRLARAFSLPRGSDAAAELAALDRAAQAAGAPDHAFSQANARLAAARSERELVKAAQDLHALERTLTR